MPGQTTTGWLRCTFADPLPVHELRADLYRWLGEPDPYRVEGAPHLSLFGVTVPASRTDEFERAVGRFGASLGPRRVPIAGYHVWPSTRNPMVVALDADVDLAAVASPLADLLAEHGGRVRWRTEAPHVTLFKGGERGERLQWPRIPRPVRDRLQGLAGDAIAAGDGEAGVADDDASGVDCGPPDSVVEPRFDLTAKQPAVEWH